MRKRVVVTGLGTINPIARNVRDSWAGVSQGKNGIIKITRFDPVGLTTQIAGEVKGFDPLEFIPKKEVKKMDVFIQYTLAACDEALKDANLEITEELGPEVGTSIGVGIGGLPNIQYYSKVIENKGPGKISPFFIPMTITNMASGYVSMIYGAKNYNATTVSACSSSNHSMGDAARIIERGDAKVMIAGGAESTICSLAIGGFGSMRALSRRNDEPEKASRPFDKDRDGFVLSEGCGILILEEYAFAKARGAMIYAELAGYGFSSDAYHITAPSAEGPAMAMKKAIQDAGVNTSEIDYINAHGTSTPGGDMNELAAIKLALGEDDAKNVSISSTKSMTGHLLGGAGGVEAVLTLKAMENNLIPPTINIENLDPECDLDVTPNHAKEKELNIAMSNSFGFGGTNATIVFKKTP